MTRAYNIDCMEAMRAMPDKAFDLAVVDPPYGIGEDGHCRTRKKHNNIVKHIKKDWDNKKPSKEYFIELKRVSINQIIWGGNYFVENLTPSMGWIYWDKMMGGDFSDGELAYTSFNRALKSVKLWNRDNWNPHIHPTQKPIALYRWLLTNYAKQGDTILDTHLGSGSSRIAADQLGFDFTGYELDTDYFEAQEKRFNQYKSQLVMEF